MGRLDPGGPRALTLRTRLEVRVRIQGFAYQGCQTEDSQWTSPRSSGSELDPAGLSQGSTGGSQPKEATGKAVLAEHQQHYKSTEGYWR